MFKKLKNNNDYNARHEFMRSFGQQCLEKVKKIQLKFKELQCEQIRCPFQGLLRKIKVLIDSYQFIAYQIYDSCQSVEYDGLGHSILKMFLQITSSVKWIMKSFIALKSTNKLVQEKQTIIQNSQNQSQRFRNRQISRFVLRGVIQQMNLEQNDYSKESLQENNILNNKQNYQNSKNKILSVSSSNLPILLQDAVDSFQKRGQYIQKFIALRENYQGGPYRNQQILTSQAILQSQLLTKNTIATEKIKQIVNKFCIKQKQFLKQNIQKTPKVQYAAQVDSSCFPSATERLKKITQKNKTKLLSEQLQKQRSINKILQTQVQQYQKKLSFTIKQNEDLNIVRKHMSFNLKNSTNRQKSKPSNFQRAQEQRSSLVQSQQKKQKVIESQKYQESIASEMNQSKINIIKLRRMASKNEMKLSKQLSSKVYDSSSNHFKGHIQLQSRVIDFYYQKQAKESCILIKPVTSQVFINKTTTSIDKLKIQSNTHQLQIIKQKLAHNIDNQNKCLALIDQISQKDELLMKIESYKPYNSCFFNTPKREIKKWSQSNTLTVVKSKENKYKKQITNFQSPLNFSNSRNLQNRILIDFAFDRHFKPKQIKGVQLEINALFNFYLDQSTAKNYEILNLSQICHQHRKIKYSAGKRAKNSIEVSKQQKKLMNICLSSSGLKKLKKINTESENQPNIVVKKIYNQIIGIRKTKKELYNKIFLFLRYPYSCINKWNEVKRKIDQFQQKPLQLSELSSFLKRIWSIHSKCMNSYQQGNQSYLKNILGWCSHKIFIIQFFGFQEIKLDQNNQVV